MNTDNLHEWLGRTEVRTDQITHMPIAKLSATLDREDPFPQNGEPLPPLWHWLYFLPLDRQSEMGPDGHPRRGGFLPPVSLPRRMIAGGQIRWHHPLHVGEVITRRSSVVDVRHKEGRTGQLVFVKLRHEISGSEGLALTEESDIVYRDKSRPGETSGSRIAPVILDWSRTVQPDEVLMFRFSALTFNSHRIHYDRRYALEQEGYPGLVVHGPLIAILLADSMRRHVPTVNIVGFSFKAVKPLFDIAHFAVNGRIEQGDKIAHLWVSDPQGYLAMDATATFA